MKMKKKKISRQIDNELTGGIRVMLEVGADLVGELSHLPDEDAIEAEIHRLWKLHCREVTKHFIEKFPGTRPELWWRHNTPGGAGRPIVRPSNGTTEDTIRFQEERRVADLRFLLQHKLLTKKEQALIVAEDRQRAELLAAGDEE